MAEDYDYECALSAQRAEGGVEFEGDGLRDLPVGWISVTLQRRAYNPEWIDLQETKRAMVQAAVQQLPPQLPPNVMQQQRTMFELQVRAQFLALEAQTPVYLTFTETIHISPPELDSALLEAFNEARSTLGMPPLDSSTIGLSGWEPQSEEGEGEENEQQDEGEQAG
jgi:hypothetical protein